ncbi:hypothetical protein OY671_012155, partial [Metschnikowia pulcherrima]
LDRHAIDHKWLQRFAMFDWVGGRTSELSAVGSSAAASQGLDINAMSAGAAAVAFAAQAGAQATDWPQHPVRIVVPFQAGSATDSISRQSGAALSTESGQPFVVEARPGAAAAIGSASVARSAPDSYTSSMGGPAAIVTNRFSRKRSAYDPDAF